jgi:ATP-binding cassette subfamily C protein
LTTPTSQTRDVYRYFFGAYAKRTALMIALMAVAGMAEGIGVLTLVPVLELVDSAEAPTSGVGATVRGAVEAIGLEPSLGVLLALIVASVTLKAGLLFLAHRQVGFTVARVVRDLRLRLMRGLFEARWSYFGERGPGRFANSVTSEASRATMAYQEACSVIAALLQMMAYLVVAMLISVWVALGALVVGGTVTLFARRFFQRTRESGEQQTSSFRTLSTRLVDALQGIKPLKAMGREGLVWPLLEHEAESLNRAKRKEVVAHQTLKAFQEPILTLMLAIGLYASLRLSGQPMSSMLTLAFVFYRLVTHINTLQNRYQFMLVGESAFFSLQKDMDEAQQQREVWAGTRPFSGLQHQIRLENLVFSYGDRRVLHGVSASVPAGSFVALHGESGSGKTTLADLIVGLHEPESGQIVIDDVPLSEWDLASWRRSIGYVPQEMLLFNETVLLNLTLGDASLSREDAEEALRLAGAWDFVMDKAGGLDHSIGDRGGMLSGGQRQRIAIARALIGRPSLLVLDEVTASLDPATEQEICDTLRELTGRVTILSISHQQAMREAADMVYEMRGGRLEALAVPEVV